MLRLLIVLFAVFATGAQAASKAAGPTLVFDPVSGEVLSQDRAGEPWYPASLTKLMTAYVVFHKIRGGQLALNQKIPVSPLAASQPPSKIGVPSGGTVTVDFALQALLVYSANDMAYVLAEAAAGSIDGFSLQMNAEAQRLGMTGSRFLNPNGLFDPRHISTARDIAMLSVALLRDYPEHAHYFSQPNVAAGKRKLANRNSLIRQMPGADGMKTGFVCNSGFNLIATATRDGRKLGAVILGASSGKHRTDLAEMLLVDGFSRAAKTPPSKLPQIENMAQGAIVPADLTPNVCRQKVPVSVVASKELAGWGISFGTFDSAVKADMALRGRLLSQAGAALTGPVGVIKMPGATNYAAVAWNIDQAQTLKACASYRAEHAPCEVMTPQVFAQIAALTPEPPKRIKQPAAQGADGAVVKSKKKKKKKR